MHGLEIREMKRRRNGEMKGALDIQGDKCGASEQGIEGYSLCMGLAERILRFSTFFATTPETHSTAYCEQQTSSL